MCVKLYPSAECKSIIIAVLAMMSVLSVVLPGIILVFIKTVLLKNMGNGLLVYI